MKIRTLLAFFIAGVFFISCVSNPYAASNPYPSVGDITTNFYDKTVDLDHYALVAIDARLIVKDFDGEPLDYPWSAHRYTRFIAVIPPGNHRFKIDFYFEYYNRSGVRTVSTANDMEVSFNFIAGRIYDMNPEFHQPGNMSLSKTTKVEVLLLDRTEKPGEIWPKWMETLKSNQ